MQQKCNCLCMIPVLFMMVHSVCSVGKSCLTLCDPMTAVWQASLSFNISQSLLKLCWVIDPIQPSYPLSPPSPPTPSFFPASGYFPVSWFFASGGQNTGSSISVLPMNIQGWFPVGWTSLILQSKGLSGVLSTTTIRKHQFFSAQPSVWSNSHICTWLLGKP